MANLCRKITGVLGTTPTTAEVDLYTENRKYPLVYDPDQDPQVIEEMQLMAAELKSGETEVRSDSDTDSNGEEDASDSEGSEPDDGLWVDEVEDEDEADDSGAESDEDAITKPTKPVKKSAKATKAKSKKAKKIYTPIDKVGHFN